MMQFHNTVMQESFTPCDHAQASDQSSCGPPASRVFLGVPDEIPVARHWLVGCLPGGFDHPAADEVARIGSEFATNAIRHSRSGVDGGMFTVVFDMDSDGRPVVGVYDLGGDTEPRAIPPTPGVLTAGGVGLYYISQVAAAWGTKVFPDGRRFTWAAVPV